MESSSVIPVSFALDSLRRVSESDPVIAVREWTFHSLKAASGTQIT